MPKKRTDLTFDPTPEQPLGMPVPINSAVEALALVIVWSRTEKRRVGECVPVPPKDALIGRGGVRPDDPADRLGFAATRPGCVIDGGPLAAPTLSRVHVRIAATADGVMFERTGKGPVELDGHRVEHGHAPPGSTLLLANELLLMCDRRAAQLPDASLARTPDFAFGTADTLRITGESAATWRLRDHIRFAAGSGAPVLVVGPPGAGKDLVARAVHAASASRDRPYVILGGATLTRADIDALQARADAPFVVIDEVSDVAPDVQPFLARLIALASSLPLPRPRIVATNTLPLSAPTANHETVRADLASRFILTARVPGLDERRVDVPLIARSILREIAAEQPEIGLRFFEDWNGTDGEPRFSAAFIDRLVRHRWQAHCRELTSLLWTSMTTATESWLDATPEVIAQLDATPLEVAFRDPNQLDAHDVREALDLANGKVAVAARDLGLKNRWVLYRLMERFDIKAS